MRHPAAAGFDVRLFVRSQLHGLVRCWWELSSRGLSRAVSTPNSVRPSLVGPRVLKDTSRLLAKPLPGSSRSVGKPAQPSGGEVRSGPLVSAPGSAPTREDSAPNCRWAGRGGRPVEPQSGYPLWRRGGIERRRGEQEQAKLGPRWPFCTASWSLGQYLRDRPRFSSYLWDGLR